jgi:hypothetical protein
MCDLSLDSHPVEMAVGMEMRFVTHHVTCCKTRVSVGSIIRGVLFMFFLSAYSCEGI